MYPGPERQGIYLRRQSASIAADLATAVSTYRTTSEREASSGFTRKPWEGADSHAAAHDGGAPRYARRALATRAGFRRSARTTRRRAHAPRATARDYRRW